MVFLCAEGMPVGHKMPEACQKNCHLDHVTCSSTCRKQHTYNKFGFLDCSKNCKFTYSNCSDGCVPNGFSETPIVEATTKAAGTIDQQQGQLTTTPASPTSVCLRACSAVSGACQVECKNDPQDPDCVTECSADYDECVQDCGANALKVANGQSVIASSTNSQKVTCMMGCSVENVECMTECQTDVTDSSCLTECTAELGECQKECNDRHPEVTPAVDVANTVNAVKVEFLPGTATNNAQSGSYSFYVDQTQTNNQDVKQSTLTDWVNPSNTAPEQSYTLHSICIRQCSLERSKCEIECSATEISCKSECKVEYDECVTECNQDYPQNVQIGQTNLAYNSGKSDIGFGSSPKPSMGISASTSSSSKSGAVVLQAAAATDLKTEVVIQTSNGQVKTTSDKPMSMLKLLCLSSCVIERKSCLNECKTGTPEAGCSTECYDEYKECVDECKEDEIEREQEKLEKEKEKLEKQQEKASKAYEFSFNNIEKDQGEDYDYDYDSSSESNER